MIALHYRLNIQKKMTVLIIVITTVILSGFAIFNYFATKTKLTKELISLSEATAARLSGNLVKPLWDVDEEEVGSVLETEMMEKRIYALVVTEGNGKIIFAGKKRDKNWGVLGAKDHIDGNYIVKDGDIIRDNDKIGSIIREAVLDLVLRQFLFPETHRQNNGCNAHADDGSKRADGRAPFEKCQRPFPQVGHKNVINRSGFKHDDRADKSRT